MFEEDTKIAEEIAEKEAQLNAATKAYTDIHDSLSDRIDKLKAAQTAQKAAYILNHGYEALLNPDTAVELYKLERSVSSSENDTIFMALAEIMGVHPYLNEDFMVRDWDSLTLQYSMQLPKSENINEETLLEAVSIMEPVVRTQQVVATQRGFSEASLRVLQGNKTFTITFNGENWTVKNQSNPLDEQETVTETYETLSEAALSLIKL